jgi:choline dehydrogenase-like flavoprotein
MDFIPDDLFPRPESIFSADTYANIRFDVVVVGSGMGGGILAHRLSQNGAKVLLLEAGNLIFPTHLSNLPRQHSPGKLNHIWSLYDQCYKIANTYNAYGASLFQGGQAFCFGGRSLFWGGTIPRMTDREFSRWPEEVRVALLGRYYKEAEKLVGKRSLRRSDYAGLVKSTIKNTLHSNFDCEYTPMALDIGRRSRISTGIFSTADLLIEYHLAENIREDSKPVILCNHVATGIKIRNDKAISLTIRDRLSGKTIDVCADKYVVACGSIESTRLLLNSGFEHPLTGIGITDHLIQYYQFVIPSGESLYSSKESLSLLCSRNMEEGMGPNTPVYNILVSLGADLFLPRFRNRQFDESVQEQRSKEMKCEIVILHNSNLDDRNYLRMPSEQKEWKMEINMHPPLLDSSAEDDAELSARMIARNLLPSRTLPESNMLVNARLGGVAHEVGSLRMSINGSDGVVDPNLKVWGVNNLYVCDLSVFCNSPAANPSLTLAALALRLGDHLAG